MLISPLFCTMPPPVSPPKTETLLPKSNTGLRLFPAGASTCKTAVLLSLPAVYAVLFPALCNVPSDTQIRPEFNSPEFNKSMPLYAPIVPTPVFLITPPATRRATPVPRRNLEFIMLLSSRTGGSCVAGGAAPVGEGFGVTLNVTLLVFSVGFSIILEPPIIFTVNTGETGGPPGTKPCPLGFGTNPGRGPSPLQINPPPPKTLTGGAEPPAGLWSIFNVDGFRLSWSVVIPTGRIPPCALITAALPLLA